MKANKIYINPYHAEAEQNGDGFNLSVTGATKNGKGQTYIIIIKFDWWWIPYLLKMIKGVLVKKINYLTSINNKIIE